MRPPSSAEMERLWARHTAEWRDQAQTASQWKEAAHTDPQLLRYTVCGAWWETLAETGATLLVTREYEHLVIAMTATAKGPTITFMPMPHPSGLAADRRRGVVYIASTRNPNQVYDLLPVTGARRRLDVKAEAAPGRPLVPVRSRFYPGCLYIHDLALIGGELYANAAGENALLRLYDDGRAERVWWPKCIEANAGPIFGQNHIQLNSTAAGRDVASSFFSASTDQPTRRRPGHRNFLVDKRGVIFSGATREAILRGLTRPHSARLHAGRVWVDNSGYGELGFAREGRFQPVVRLPGWTRGLCFCGRIAFVGTSRVIPRFSRYAPGLDQDSSLCAVHAVDTASGRVLGSLIWPYGNQIFAMDWVPAEFSCGFPFHVGARRATVREKVMFYSYTTRISGEGRSRIGEGR